MDPRTDSTPSRTDSPLPRILLYSHDSFGLGHLRRSITIAAALVESLPGANVLIATGSACATHFTAPPGVDVVKLPSATKDERGAYVSRGIQTSLTSLVDLRSQLLVELVRSFRPHVLIVDQKVLGLGGELTASLEAARAQGTRTILGIRDIIDEPEVVAREWGSPEVRRALVESYDRVCVYGAPEVFDARTEYPIPPELAPRIEFCGYVVRRPNKPSFRAVPGLRPRVLVTVGGGEDGADRIETYLEMLETEPVEWESTILLGPLVDASRARKLKRRARLQPSVTAHLFYEDLPRLLGSCDAVVAMAGYNTTAEILDSRVPAVFVPRCFPRKEQLIRATRLARAGLAQCLARPTPDSLRRAIREALRGGRTGGVLPPLTGAREVCRVAIELFGDPRVEAKETASR